MQKLISWAQGVAQRRRIPLQWACMLLIAAAFMVFSVFHGPARSLDRCATWQERRTFILLLGGLYVAAMAVCLLVKRWEWPPFLFAATLLMVALYMRVAVFNQVTADYTSFLRGWVDVFREHGAAALAMDVGDYNLPYQYILAIIAKTPLDSMYLIKYVSIFFDFALAILMMRLVERFVDQRYGLAALAAVLLAPTVWFNGAFWAQCDALYCFFVMACLYAMLADRPILSVAMLTVAFSFKLQTIFFFPIVLLALWGKKIKLRHLLAFPAVYLLLMLPALLSGRSLLSALTIYARQASQYNDRLTYNAANIYQFFPFGELSLQPAYTPILKFIPGVETELWGKWYTLDSIRYLLVALVPYAGMLILCLVYYLFNHRKKVGMAQIWRLSLAFTLLMPLVLPKMHDRYFALAEVCAILYAARYPKRWYVPALVIFASFESYMPFLARERPVDMRFAAAMMIVAMGVVLRDIVLEMRADAR
jgi:Gpi18-like mannosyltransferase